MIKMQIKMVEQQQPEILLDSLPSMTAQALQQLIMVDPMVQILTFY